MTGTSSRPLERPNRDGASRAGASGYGPRFYTEAERMLVGRAYHDLFKDFGIAPLAGRKLYRFATRLGPVESSIDVSRRMAYIYFRYLDIGRAVPERMPSDGRYRSATFNPISGKLNGHVVADEEQATFPDLALQMIEGFRAILNDLDAQPLGTGEPVVGPVPARFYSTRPH